MDPVAWSAAWLSRSAVYDAFNGLVSSNWGHPVPVVVEWDGDHDDGRQEAAVSFQV
jgi:hypothetical protein